MIDEKFKKMIISFIFLLITTVLIGKVLGQYVYINLTRSEPLGLYLKVNEPFQKGDYVVVEVPMEWKALVYGRHWLPQDCPFLKNVGAVEGDIFYINQKEFYVDGKYIGPVFEADKYGQELPKLRGTHYVQKNYFLAVSSYNDSSFDSRYMGELPNTSVITKVVPLFLFE